MARTKEEIIERLQKLQSPNPSGWKEKAEWERQNREWIRRSQYIAVMMLSRMEELHMSQTSLAIEMGCSQQYVSKILKGKENLSLETISKVEDALGITFFTPSNQTMVKKEEECFDMA